MTLNDTIKSAMLEDLRHTSIMMLSMYARQNRDTISFLYDQGILDDNSIEGALEYAVIKQAKKDYNTMTARGRSRVIYPDHVGMPECLAYALDHGTFSERELRNIHFDHGDTAATFSQKYVRENLLSRLREELLNPEALPFLAGDDDAYHA
jgi:hypothetical protein